MNQQQRDIEVQEKKLSAIYPGLIKNRTITSIDNSGIILENASDTQLTKLFFKRRDQDKQLKQVIQFNNEVAALRLFHENSIDNIETPIILKEPQWLLSDDFFCYVYHDKDQGYCC